jgi:hypothetical protein
MKMGRRLRNAKRLLTQERTERPLRSVKTAVIFALGLLDRTRMGRLLLNFWLEYRTDVGDKHTNLG